MLRIYDDISNERRMNTGCEVWTFELSENIKSKG